LWFNHFVVQPLLGLTNVCCEEAVRVENPPEGCKNGAVSQLIKKTGVMD